MQYKHINGRPINYTLFIQLLLVMFFSNHLSVWLHAKEIFISIYICFLCKFIRYLQLCRKMKVQLTCYISFFSKGTEVLFFYLIWCCNILSCREQLLLCKMTYLFEVYSQGIPQRHSCKNCLVLLRRPSLFKKQEHHIFRLSLL